MIGASDHALPGADAVQAVLEQIDVVHQIKKVAGRNLLRAMRGAERIAAEIQRAAAGQ